jgi:hypothetical protein
LGTPCELRCEGLASPLVERIGARHLACEWAWLTGAGRNSSRWTMGRSSGSGTAEQAFPGTDASAPPPTDRGILSCRRLAPGARRTGCQLGPRGVAPVGTTRTGTTASAGAAPSTAAASWSA